MRSMYGYCVVTCTCGLCWCSVWFYMVQINKGGKKTSKKRPHVLLWWQGKNASKQGVYAMSKLVKSNAKTAVAATETVAQLIMRLYGAPPPQTVLLQLWADCKVTGKASQCLVVYAIFCILAKNGDFALSDSLARSVGSKVIPHYAVSQSGEYLSEAKNPKGGMYFKDCHATMRNGTGPKEWPDASGVYALSTRISQPLFDVVKAAFIDAVKNSGALTDKIAATTKAIKAHDYDTVIKTAVKLSTK